MGQKVHPYGFRLGVVKTWKSKWYEDKNYAKWLHEDLKLKAAIRKKFAHAGIAEIEMERAANKAKVVIYTSRPGIIIGKRGAGVEQLKADLQKLTENELFLDIRAGDQHNRGRPRLLWLSQARHRAGRLGVGEVECLVGHSRDDVLVHIQDPGKSRVHHLDN